jgi:tetratricopeptide (TPR) repeat protein
MFRKTNTIFVIMLMLSSTGIWSQKQLKKAELQLESGEYIKSIYSYKAYLKENPNDFFTVSKLAEVLTLAGDFSQAHTWYESIPKNAQTDPFTFKKHGDLLKKMFRYEDAIEKYKIFSKTNAELASQCIHSVEFAKAAMSHTPKHEIILLPSNSSSSDFGLTFYNTMPVFSSFREDILMTETEREMNVDNSSHKSFLYNNIKNRLVFIKGLNGNLNHIGPLSFAATNNKCAIIQGKLKDNYNLIRSFSSTSLYIAEVNSEGEMTSSKPFIFNEVQSSINAAHLAFDGSAIYFSSDRKGGYGGFDIYVSYMNNGKWSLPENLGPNVNSVGDEVTPFLYKNKLFFASDHHAGLGGFDIHQCEVNEGAWSKPTNLGNGINSPADDYFPAYNDKDELYVTSNRLGGRGNNDIYKVFMLNDVKIEEEFTFIPQAVSLDDLILETEKHTLKTEDNVTSVALKESESQNTAFKLPEFDTKKVGTNALAELTLVGAHRIALEEMIPNTEVFFIQLASMSTSKPNFNKFKPLLRYGNIYKMLNNKVIKVRLGYFTDRKEAEDILVKVRANGYKDAFIAFEVLNTAQMELILTGTDEQSFTDNGNFNTRNPEVARDYKSGNKYKVRLASYEDPIWFDVNKVKDLGRIEQWTKGGWTIFILAGYADLETAKKAQIQANNRGFKTAEVVIDNGGILERLKQN